MIDVETVKARVDLLDLIGRDVQLRKVASTRGGEYAGPCPFCGGHDRLRVQPDKGLWWCRQCGGEHWQDAIAYMMLRERLSFPEACAKLTSGDLPLRSTPRPSAPPPAAEPTEEWRKASEMIVEECERALWSDLGGKARAWLNARGLRDGTLLGWRVGYNLRDREIAGQYVKAGIVIPWRAGGQLWHVNVRRPKGEPKYQAIAGGHPHLFGADGRGNFRVCVLVEGEFDAMLLRQEAGALAWVATLGSASKGLDPIALRELVQVPRIILAYDADAAGEEGAARLATLSARIRRCEGLEAGQDVTDFWRSGGDLRGWLAYNLEVAA